MRGHQHSGSELPARARFRGAILLQVENFLQHGEALAVLLIRNGFEQAAHELLPALIDGVFVEFVPGLVEILGAQDQGQILTAAKDGIIADSDFLQLGQQLRPDPLVLAFRILRWRPA